MLPAGQLQMSSGLKLLVFLAPQWGDRAHRRPGETRAGELRSSEAGSCGAEELGAGELGSCVKDIKGVRVEPSLAHSSVESADTV